MQQKALLQRLNKGFFSSRRISVSTTQQICLNTRLFVSLALTGFYSSLWFYFSARMLILQLWWWVTWAKYLRMSYVDKGPNYAQMRHKNTPTNQRYPVDTYCPKYQEYHGSPRKQDQDVRRSWQDHNHDHQQDQVFWQDQDKPRGTYLQQATV